MLCDYFFWWWTYQQTDKAFIRRGGLHNEIFHYTFNWPVLQTVAKISSEILQNRELNLILLNTYILIRGCKQYDQNICHQCKQRLVLHLNWFHMDNYDGKYFQINRSQVNNRRWQVFQVSYGNTDWGGMCHNQCCVQRVDYHHPWAC